MAFAVSDLEDFLALLRQHPEWRERVREVILGDDIAESNARFARIEATLDRIAAAIERIWAKREQHDTKLDALTVKTDALTVTIDALTGSVNRLDARMDRVEGKLGNLEGADFERRFNVLSRLGPDFGRGERTYIGSIEALMRARSMGVLSEAEIDQIASLDYIIRARRGPGADAPEVFIACEISMTVDAGDVRRAADRAGLMGRAGLDAVPYVGGQVATAEATALVAELGVVLVISRAAPAA